ncbi:hypothetical protein ACHAXT_011039 [Thalassiosira profunda]
MSALHPPRASPASPLNGGSDADSQNGKDKHSRQRCPCHPSCNSTSCAPVCPPPSFNDPDTRSTRPYYLFPLFLLINIATMSDRSIIAGASQEFSAFVSSAHDSPPKVQENPDMGIGLLQAAFIFGYSVAILLSGHYVHKIRWKPLVFTGMCVWWLGVLGSGNAKHYDSFWVLLFSRMATGCSEAAFQVVAPPLIHDRGGDRAGLWLSVYLTGLPVGLAFGYIYGSRMAGSEKWGWDWAYYWMCIASVPLIVALAFVKDETNGGILSGAGEYNTAAVDRQHTRDDDSSSSDGDEGLTAETPLLASEGSGEAPVTIDEEGHVKRKFTFWTEVKACLSSPVLVTLSLGWAAIIGVVASLGTFGGSFTLALQLYDDERDAAYWFGIAAALAGIIGTPLGGNIADRILIRYVGHASSDAAGRAEGVDDSLRFPIIESMVTRVNILVAVSLLFVFPTLAMQEAAFFLTFLFIGWTLLFMTQTSVNLTAMMSVARCHRPNALAFLMLTSHFLGDVPLPIILGLIKDKLAPACRIGSSGEFDDPEGCKEQEAGVRQTLAIAYSWVLWSLLFFELSRRFARRELRREISEARREEVNSLLLQEDGEESSFQYYHSRFQPPKPNQTATDDAPSSSLQEETP